MKYAIISDLHSAKDDTVAVLSHIQTVEPAAKLIGLGDLFECVIGKKRAVSERFNRLEEVIINLQGFEELLTFPSVIGNQEERILMITKSDEPLMDKLKTLPKTIEIDGAIVTHGHEWEWSGDPWSPKVPRFNENIVFYGHSHRSGFFEDGKWIPSIFGIPQHIQNKKYAINVGAVVEHREWLLYDSNAKFFTFFKADKV